MSIRPQSEGCKPTTRRGFGHLRVIGIDEAPVPLLADHCLHCLDTGLDLYLVDRLIKARPCGKCVTINERSKWSQKLAEAEHLNQSRYALSSKVSDVLTSFDYLQREKSLPEELRGRIEDLFSSVSKPGPRTPVSPGELALVIKAAEEGRLWAGKLEAGETSCPHLISRIPAFFRPETRGRKVAVLEGSISRGKYGETILVKPQILTTAHQRIILALTHLHHQKGFHSNRTETSLKEILRLLQKKSGGTDVRWLKEKLNEIQMCHITIVNDLGGLYGATSNDITTANKGSPILTWEELPRGIIATWNEYYLRQYRCHLYSRLTLSVTYNLPPVAQLIYVFLASHDNDASWMKVSTWMTQLGFDENKATRETFRNAIRSLEEAKLIHPETIFDQSVWILLTRGINFEIPWFAPEIVRERADSLIADARRPKLATETEAKWGPHSQGRSLEKATRRRGATAERGVSEAGKLAKDVALFTLKKSAEAAGDF